MRSDIKDVICWEALAESYEREGRFTSALKAYRKVCALDERSLLATFRIGSILLILGHYVEAVEHLHCALVLCEDDDQRVPVWNALASANLELSGDQIEKGVYGSAADCLALAVKHGRKCIYYDTALDSPWVVVGRALITFAEIPNYLSLCPWNTVQDLVKSNKAGSLTHDFPSLSKALDDRQSLAGVAHAASICLASALTANSSADQWREFALALHTSDDFDGAVKAAKHALLLDSKSARCWMTLGDLMARRDAGIAQHAYIKAIECDTLVFLG